MQPTARRHDQERTDGVLFGGLGARTSALLSAGTLRRAQGWNPTKASIPLRSVASEASFPLSPVSTLPHYSQSPVPSQPQPFPLRHDLICRCHCRDAEHAEHVAQGARWHGRAPRAGCGAHVGERTVRWPCKLHAPHGRTTCAVQRSAHHATCPATRTCHTPQCASAFAVQPIDSGHAS